MASVLERLYDAHAQALFAFLLNLLRNEADAMDVLQDVFVKLAIRPLVLDRVSDERAFLIRMAHNHAINCIRRQRAREHWHEQVEDAPLFVSAPNSEEHEFQAAIGAALAELPPEQRAVMHLKIWEGFTFEAIAQTLNISPNTAASRYRYALDKLRARLRPVADELT